MAVVVTPRSSRALCHLGEVMYLLHEDDLKPNHLKDMELYYRSAIDMEGKNIHETEPPLSLLDTTFWKVCILFLNHEYKGPPPPQSTQSKSVIIRHNPS